MNGPERIYNVSKTQFSVSRFYGGCKFNGVDYHYDAASDTLTRMDVWKARCASSKEEAENAAKVKRYRWTQMQQDFSSKQRELF